MGFAVEINLWISLDQLINPIWQEQDARWDNTVGFGIHGERGRPLERSG